ncbi:MAG TPA: HEAT repeat domain-containing protein [Tepidisphaeraceae bacterium]
MESKCPACGRALENGQTVCTCGRRVDETPSAGGTILVLLGGGFVVVVLAAIILGAGVILWKQFSHRATTASRTPAPSMQPNVPTAPSARAMPVTALPLKSGGVADAGMPTIGPATRPTRMAPSPIASAPPRSPSSPPISAEEGLLKDLHSPDREVRRRAAAILQLRGWEPANDEQSALVLVAMDNPLAAERYGDAAVEALCMPLLDGRASGLSIACAESLGRLLDARAVQPLGTALRVTSDPDLRQAAATALGHIRDAGSIPVLEQALAANESNDATKQSIAVALTTVTDSKGADRLVAALKDDEPRVQLRAAILLARRGDPHAIAWLEQAINGDDPELRGRAIDVLRQLASPDAIQVLVRRVGGRGFDGPAEAADALARIGPPAVQPMVDALPKMPADAQRAMLIGLARIGPPAMPSLTKALRAGSGALKRNACETLGRIGDREDVAHTPVEPLIALLDDADPKVRRSAVHALDLLRWEPADDAQRERLAKAKEAS